MADTDVAVVGLARAYLVAEITSAALACFAQKASHFTYFLRCRGRQALCYNNNGGSSAKNGASLCICLQNKWQRSGAPSFLDYRERTTGTMAEEPAGDEHPAPRFNGTGWL